MLCFTNITLGKYAQQDKEGGFFHDRERFVKVTCTLCVVPEGAGRGPLGLAYTGQEQP